MPISLGCHRLWLSLKALILLVKADPILDISGTFCNTSLMMLFTYGTYLRLYSLVSFSNIKVLIALLFTVRKRGHLFSNCHIFFNRCCSHHTLQCKVVNLDWQWKFSLKCTILRHVSTQIKTLDGKAQVAVKMAFYRDLSIVFYTRV